MFTGIVTATADIKKSAVSGKGLNLAITKPHDWDDISLGESISVNGVCLTVAAIRTHELEVSLVPETLSKTTFGLSVPKVVNLERALRASDGLSGHFVQGHVDTVGKVSKTSTAEAYEVEITYPTKFAAYLVPKGSITVDGVALTIVSCTASVFTVALVPFTLQHTTLSKLSVGSDVNLEFDMLGKYIVNFMEQKHAAG